MQNDDLEVVREVIRNTNEEIRAKNLHEINLQDFSYNNSFASVSTTKGIAGVFSTFLLKGVQQYFNETYGRNQSIFRYNLTLELKELRVSFKYNYKFYKLFEGSGHIELSAGDHSFQAVGQVTTSKNGECYSNLSKLIINDIKEFDVLVGNKEHTIIKYITDFVANKIFPYLLPGINKHIEEEVTNLLPKSDFPKIVCDSFVVPQSKLGFIQK